MLHMQDKQSLIPAAHINDQVWWHMFAILVLLQEAKRTDWKTRGQLAHSVLPRDRKNKRSPASTRRKVRADP